MGDRDKFRVWCENKNEYETHEVVADQNGRLYHHARMSQTLRKDTHIRENCTGLKDKNGKLIYDGDICKNELLTVDEDDPVYSRIAYALAYSGWLWCTMRSDGDGEEPTDFYGGVQAEYLEVVGNIHENPELLAEKEAGG